MRSNTIQCFRKYLVFFVIQVKIPFEKIYRFTFASPEKYLPQKITIEKYRNKQWK